VLTAGAFDDDDDDDDADNVDDTNYITKSNLVYKVEFIKQSQFLIYCKIIAHNRVGLTKFYILLLKKQLKHYGRGVLTHVDGGDDTRMIIKSLFSVL